MKALVSVQVIRLPNLMDSQLTSPYCANRKNRQKKFEVALDDKYNNCSEKIHGPDLSTRFTKLLIDQYADRVMSKHTHVMLVLTTLDQWKGKQNVVSHDPVLP